MITLEQACEIYIRSKEYEYCGKIVGIRENSSAWGFETEEAEDDDGLICISKKNGKFIQSKMIEPGLWDMEKTTPVEIPYGFR